MNMEEKSSKHKRIVKYYVPPPARTPGVRLGTCTRQKERPVKASHDTEKKLCDDSSLLFKELPDKPKRNKSSTKQSNLANDSSRSVVANACDGSFYAITSQTEKLHLPVVLSDSDEALCPKPLSKFKGSLESLENENVNVLSGVSLVSELEEQTIHPSIVTERIEPPAPSELQYSDLNENSNLSDDGLGKDCSIVLKISNVIIDPKASSPKILDQGMCCSELDNDNGSDSPPDRGICCSEVDNDNGSDSPPDGGICCSDVDNDNGSDSPPDGGICCSELDNDNESDSPPDVGEELMSVIDESRSAKYCAIQAPSDNSVPTVELITKNNSEMEDLHSLTIDDADWDTIYDDQGNCLVNDTVSLVGCKLKAKADTKTAKLKTCSPRPNNENEDKPYESSSIIEIYGFSEDLKTKDLIMAFSNYIEKGFNLKWVDTTHALGVFPTTVLADEVLSKFIPLVKTRPISQGTPLSQEMARTLVLPSSLRPKTCTASIRRLVSGALGLRVKVSPEERAAELKLLKEAREQRKLEQKQREAVWKGT